MATSAHYPRCRRHSPSGEARSEAICDPQRVRLEQLQRRLLRQHHVPRYQAALREEAPAADAPAVAVELLDVHLPAVSDAIALARLAAGDIEKPVLLVLAALGNSEILLEQLQTA